MPDKLRAESGLSLCKFQSNYLRQTREFEELRSSRPGCRAGRGAGVKVLENDVLLGLWSLFSRQPAAFAAGCESLPHQSMFERRIVLSKSTLLIGVVFPLLGVLDSSPVGISTSRLDILRFGGLELQAA